jgi:hypothetical protein
MNMTIFGRRDADLKATVSDDAARKSRREMDKGSALDSGDRLQYSLQIPTLKIELYRELDLPRGSLECLRRAGCGNRTCCRITDGGVRIIELWCVGDIECLSTEF